MLLSSPSLVLHLRSSGAPHFCSRASFARDFTPGEHVALKNNSEMSQWPNTALQVVRRPRTSPVNPAKLIVVTLGVFICAVAVLGAVSFYRDYPRVSTSFAVLLLLLLALAWHGNYHRTRDMALSESILANSPCPQCGTRYGTSAAYAAFHPLPPLEPTIDDDFGVSDVTCPACGAKSWYSRDSHELEFPPQLRAIQLFPDLGVSNSRLNQEFVRRQNQYQKDNNQYFADPEWPAKLAREADDAIKHQ